MSIKARGSGFLVNTYTSDRQGNPSIDPIPAKGGFQIVWKNEGQGEDGLGVFGQNFTRKGAKNGAEMQLNQLTVGDKRTPDVAFNETGAGRQGLKKGLYRRRTPTERAERACGSADLLRGQQGIGHRRDLAADGGQGIGDSSFPSNRWPGTAWRTRQTLGAAWMMTY